MYVCMYACQPKKVGITEDGLRTFIQKMQVMQAMWVLPISLFCSHPIVPGILANILQDWHVLNHLFDQPRLDWFI